MSRREVVGGVLAGLAALNFGITVVIGRHLAASGFGSSEILGVRFALAAACIFGLLAVVRRPLLPVRGERWRAVVLGGIGYAGQATLFYLALSKGTAGAVALLFYAYPAIVTVLDAAAARRRPSWRSIAAVASSAVGAAVVVTVGGRVTISRGGVVLALLAAAGFSLYLVAGDRLLPRSDSSTVSAWVALGAGVSLLARALLTTGVHLPASELPGVLLYGATTGAAFVCMFAALRRIGSARAAVIMTLEALFAVLLGAVFLSESIGFRTALGGAAILGGAVLATTARTEPSERRPVGAGLD